MPGPSSKRLEKIIKAFNKTDMTLEVLGSGPSEIPEVTENIKLLGQQSQDVVRDRMAKAQFIIIASNWYECFPRTILEAFSMSTPVLSSNIGNMKNIIKDNKTGVFFEAGNPTDLREKAKYLFENPIKTYLMGKNAYSEYKMHYTAQKNYEMLMSIYEKSINNINV